MNTENIPAHHTPIAASIDNSNESNNYDMTEDDATPPVNSPGASISTTDLLRRIDDLSEMLELERDNNTALMSTIQLERNTNTTEINDLRIEMQKLHVPTPTPPPPKNDARMYGLIEQQQAMMQSQMQQNSTLLHEFGKGLQALQQATMKSALATERQAEESINARIKKGPMTNRFPKFSAKENEIFLDWYDDILCILALSEWSALYDSTTNDICDITTETNIQISEHLYTSLRLALQGEAGSIMKSNEHKYRNKGIEYLQSMKPIFHPQWPPSTHNTKLVAFYNNFRNPTTSIDKYANQFKRLLRDLRYNGITINPESAKHTFLQGLGSEFITIRNMKTPPSEFQTDDIDTLTTVAREHLARIVGNRAIQKQQQQLIRSNPPPNSQSSPNNNNTPNAAPPNPAPANRNNPPNNAPTPRPGQYPDQPDYQREIMREIGFGVHTPARIAYWQSLTEPANCYFHRIPHSSTDCGRLQRAVQRARAGNPPTSTFIPNPQFTTPPANPSPAPPQTPTPAPPRPPPAPRNPTPAPTARVVTAIIESEDESEDSSIVDINNYNYDADYYSSSNSPKCSTNKPKNQFRFIVDSGATDHMCNSKELFTSLTAIDDDTNAVTLGDGTTTSPIKGKGTIAYQVQHHIVHLHNVLYVPNLNVSLYSIKQHMKVQGCSEHSEANTCTIAYPTFTIKASTKHEIEFIATIPSDTTKPPDFDSNQTIDNIKPANIPYYFKADQQHPNIKISSTFKTKPIKNIPTRSTPDSIGYDLFSSTNTSIPPNSRKSVGLGFSIAIPQGLYGRIAPRSGLALNHNIDVAGGVIDPDYRGKSKSF